MARLPQGFQELEYIKGSSENKGSNWINTGIPMAADTKVELGISWNNSGDSNYGRIIGLDNVGHLAAGQWGNNIDLNGGNSTHIGAEKIDIEITNSNWSADGEIVKTFSAVTSFTGTNVVLSTNIVGEYQDRDGAFSIWYCKIYDGEELIFDAVPCYRIEDEEVGLYDLIADEFIENSGSGVFVAGPEVIYPTINIEYMSIIPDTAPTKKNVGEPPYAITAEDLPEIESEYAAFAGWYYEDTFETLAEVGDEIEEDTTLYVKWDFKRCVVSNESLFVIANAIRYKTEASEPIEFPGGFVEEILSIDTELPVGLQKLEYVEVVDNTSRIDTGLRAYGDNHILGVRITYALTEVQYDKYAFGNYASNYNRYNYLIGNLYEDYHSVSGPNDQRWNLATIDTNVIHTISVNLDEGEGVGIYFDGEKKVNGTLSQSDSGQNVFYTSENHDNSAVNHGAKAKHYGCDVYLNDELVRHYIPCKNLNTNEVGFFDTITCSFYTSLGAAYVAGPEV